jgi:glutaredoxin 2
MPLREQADALNACYRRIDALEEAGHVPHVVKCYGLAGLPDVTSGRKEVKRLTGESFVPVLVLDDGTFIADSNNIVDWAREHPAGSAG